jgi:hypothetical protein
MDWTVEENVFFRVGNADGSYGVIIGNGQSYINVRNNVFVDCANAVEVSFFLNGWASNQVPTFQARWQDLMNTYNNFTNMPHGQKYPGLPLLLQEDRILPDSNTFKQNLVWNPTVPLWYHGAYTTRYGDLSLVQAQDNYIASSDPGFVDWQGGDFSLREGADAFTAIPGFVAPPFREMGLRDAVGIPAADEILSTAPASGLQATSAELNGVWQRNWGTAFEIEVFWGRTDGGTNPIAWENHASLGLLINGETIHFSYGASNLDTNTTYYFTFRATNALETIWAEESGSAATLGMPSVDSASGPTAVSATSAMLQGILTAGSAADAWICWGPMDGGTNSMANWEHAEYVGAVTQNVTFSKTLAGLATSQTYWYRCVVSNVVGVGWASEVKSFSGMPVGGIPWSPTNITMAAWYDAADTNTITLVGSKVSAWKTKAGITRTLSQTTDANRPLYVGNSYIQFDGVDDLLAVAGFDSMPDITVFTVSMTYSNAAVTDANKSLMCNWNGSTSNPDWWLPNRTHENTQGAYMSAGAGSPGANSAAIRGITHIRAFTSLTAASNGLNRVDGGTAQNEIVANGSAMQNGTGRTFHVGRQKADASRYFQGRCQEIIIVASRMLPTDASGDYLKIEGYLAHKWGIAANLPADHPYKSTHPGGSGAVIGNRAPTGISETDATFNAALNASGTNYDITVHYGTTDGGTNAGVWGASEYVGSWMNVASTNISYAVSGLVGGQTCYYTFMASNAAGSVWASPSWTFTTPGTPQETIVVKPVTSVLDVSAILNGQWLGATGTVYGIDAFWGESDGGTNAGAWAHSASLGTFTNDITPAFSHSINGLTPGTAYRYAFRATNRTDTLWTLPGGTFVTASAPVVDNSTGATAASETSATLSGLLSAGVEANVWICWGAADGGVADTGNWANVVSAGSATEGNAFSNLVTGLSSNTTYFYRCYAENAYGSDWSDTAAAFSGTPVGGDCFGGTVTNLTISGTNYTAHIFTNSGTFSVFGGGSCDVLLVGGGGGGGGGISGTVYNYGGGGGQVLSVSGLALTAGQYTVLVGSGGIATGSGTAPNGTGGLSSFAGYTATGGGTPVENSGRAGSSGSGNLGGTSNTSAAGGGGGDSAVGNNAPSTTAGGAGGTGTANTLLGTTYYYGGGGGGRAYTTQGAGGLGGGGAGGVAGTANTGGGGGGGVNGGSGIVIVRYQQWNSAVKNLAPTIIADNAATFNAALNASGTNYDITVHYGTTDGGTNAGVWGASEYAGSWTNVSTNISYAASGLVGGTTYYYTFMASNTAGAVWASPSWTFRTPVVPSATTNYLVPHTWLEANVPGSTNDFEAAVLDDPDGDGFTTWQEYWAGTDPQDSNSYLKIDSVIFDGTNIVIVWSNAVVGAGLPPLGIQARTDLLSGSWSNAGQKALANGVNSWSNSAAQQLYYRLAVTNAP